MVKVIKVIAAVLAVILFPLFCVLIAAGLLWVILMIAEVVIELWREINE